MGTPLLECSKGSKCEALTTTILREDHPKGHSIFCLLGLPTTQLFQGPLSHHRLPPGRIMIMPTLLPTYLNLYAVWSWKTTLSIHILWTGPGINYIQHLKKIIGVIFKILVQAKELTPMQELELDLSFQSQSSSFGVVRSGVTHL
ncbi:uncharacterized protein LOC128997323 [Macrosteles quadrilineatus]|uniref:uncharacterized protein LOC128997323 n=1 Tax=Macrosteles quadrilineatus TaxID=74068 RepID=UPI0023E2141A|nr:uncharacterized protein LOC128997323 [Macrosteles quadrilineatus]